MATDLQVLVQDESGHVVVESNDVSVVAVREDAHVVVEDTAVHIVSVAEQGPAGVGLVDVIRLIPRDTPPAGPNQVGWLYTTTAGVLKSCTVAGSPGTWESVGAQT